jgi:hypothetical protein
LRTAICMDTFKELSNKTVLFSKYIKQKLTLFTLQRRLLPPVQPILFVSCKEILPKILKCQKIRKWSWLTHLFFFLWCPKGSTCSSAGAHWPAKLQRNKAKVNFRGTYRGSWTVRREMHRNLKARNTFSPCVSVYICEQTFSLWDLRLSRRRAWSLEASGM